MENSKHNLDRRVFLRNSISVASGIAGLSMMPEIGYSKSVSGDDNIHLVGPRDGFSPHVGTLLSMMTWMRATVLRSVKGLTKEQLDYLHDAKSNTIGAMLLHLAATEKYYQLHTFENKKWGDWDDKIKKQWDVPMNLGDVARNTIKGNELSYYENILTEVRQKTIDEFKKRDDQWLAQVDPAFFGNMPTNNHCKWFHVCEHESNHNGQIKYIKSRLPGAKSTGD